MKINIELEIEEELLFSGALYGAYRIFMNSQPPQPDKAEFISRLSDAIDGALHEAYPEEY